MSALGIPHDPSTVEIEAAEAIDRAAERNARLQRIHDRAVVQALVRSAACPADFSLLTPARHPCDLP